MRGVIAVLVAIAAATGCSSEGGERARKPADAASSSFDDVRSETLRTGSARVIVTLRQTLPPSSPRALRRAAIAGLQEAVLRSLPARHLTLARRYATTPAFSAQVTAEGARLLRSDPRVLLVQLDAPGGGGGSYVDNAVPMGADQLQSIYGLRGDGVRVAVLDSGVDVTHPDLAPALVAQHCFTHGNCPPSNTDESEHADDAYGHGTNVSGIVLSRGTIAPEGFAPAADLVAVRVLDGNNAGYMSDWIAGLDWIAQNQSTLQISILNMSLKTNAHYPGTCDTDWPAMESVVAELRADGVALFACSGNEGEPSSLSAPSCNTGVVAVGATYTGDIGVQPAEAGTYEQLFGAPWPFCGDSVTSLDTVACFSNGSARVDLLLPGATVTSTGLSGGTSLFRGTSQASPAAAGLAVLMRQCAPGISPDEILLALRQSGDAITDPKNGISTPRVRGEQAVLAACPCLTHVDGAPCEGGICAGGVCAASGPGSGGMAGAPSGGSAGSANGNVGGSAGGGGHGGSANVVGGAAGSANAFGGSQNGGAAGSGAAGGTGGVTAAGRAGTGGDAAGEAQNPGGGKQSSAGAQTSAGSGGQPSGALADSDELAPLSGSKGCALAPGSSSPPPTITVGLLFAVLASNRRGRRGR